MREALSRITLVYLTFGVLFTVITEIVVAANDPEDLKIAMRLLFLAVSSALLILLVRREFLRRQEVEDRLLHAERSESLARLAGGVAHDFNNLLTVILGYTEIVLNDVGPEHRSSGDLEAVKRAGEQARSLVDQLLTLTHHRVAQPEPVDPNETISSLREVLRRLVGPDVELHVLAFDGPSVLIDPSQLEQVVLNLVINARDAMPDGGRLTLAASAGRLSTGIPAVDLRVTDTGVGMKPATAQHCFEPFFTTKARSEGTGLGLATVAAIVRQAGGEVSVDTTVNKGTTFIVRLPAVERAADKPSPAADHSGGAEHVLIVEDDDRVRGFARRVLEDNGYVAHDVASGSEAVSLLRAGERPDLVVTDVLMPVMGGVELAERMVELAPGTPVLFVSGYAEDPRLHHMAGEVPFLPKPFSPPDLLRAVREAIDGSTGLAAHGSNR